MVFVVIIEVKPETNFVVYHIEYSASLLTTHPKYMYFQDMLSSNVRYKISFFLQTLLEEGWNLIGQSQNNSSIFYTLKNDFKES